MLLQPSQYVLKSDQYFVQESIHRWKALESVTAFPLTMRKLNLWTKELLPQCDWYQEQLRRAPEFGIGNQYYDPALVKAQEKYGR